MKGTAKVGHRLSASVSSYTAGAKLTYSWLRDGKAIKGATGASYKAAKTDKGHRLSVNVTVSASGYASVSKTSSSVRIG